MFRRPLAALVALTAAFAVGAAGCGGGAGGGSAGGAASVVPKNTAAFVAIDTDTSSDQWKAASSLLAKFPDGDQVTAMIQRELSRQNVDWETDVKPALGPEVDVAVFNANASQPDVVLLTQPDDQSKLDALLRKGDQPAVKTEIGGWTAVAEKQATLDRLKQETDNGTLADNDAFNEATKNLDEGALVRFYADGKQLTNALRQNGAFSQVPAVGNVSGADWVSGTVEARDEGVVVHATAKGAQGTSKDYKADLAAKVPGDAVALVSFNNLEEGLRRARAQLGNAIPGVDQQIAQFEAAAHVSLDKDVLPLFGKEGALYVAPASPIPAVTLALKVDDEQAALATVDKLAALVGHPQTVDVAGVSAHEIPVGGNFRLIYAAFDGTLVLTTAEEGISGLKSDGPKLVDDPTFQDAKSSADMPDETGGFVYLDGQRIARMAYGFAATSGQQVPDRVRRNVAPLKSFIAFSSQDGDTSKVTALLRIE